jgi:hypothetical protein
MSSESSFARPRFPTYSTPRPKDLVETGLVLWMARPTLRPRTTYFVTVLHITRLFHTIHNALKADREKCALASYGSFSLFTAAGSVCTVGQLEIGR